MSKHTDSKDETKNYEPDNPDNPDNKDEDTNNASSSSTIKYDVIFDDDDNALDLGELASSGQGPDAIASDKDGERDHDESGNSDDASRESAAAATSDSTDPKTGNHDSHQDASQPSSTTDSNATEATTQQPTSEESAESDKRANESDDKAIPDSAATSNAQRVNETLGLALQAENELSAHIAKSPVVEPATALSSRLDKETIAEADILLKPNPTFALDHVTFTNNKTGRNVLDNIDWGFFAGSLYAITGADDEQRRTLLEVAAGFYRPNSGQVMVKSQSLLELETNEIRGHRIGLITQRYSLRDDLDALTNLTFTMRASGRTFLKPIPVVARDVLKYVDFAEAATGVKVADLKPVNQRRLAIARAICCEATVILADDPVGGLGANDREAILDLLSRIAHAQDPKRCVIVLVPGFGSQADEGTGNDIAEGTTTDTDTGSDTEAGNDHDGSDTETATESDATADTDEYSSETDYEAKADKVYSL
ncbi:ATP-binding cassette domain-containing protein [Bifidobacterium sp. ESL0704]|uniref:ATP-binding cassette domain-containing protein n=1 Tax=Bifidobacterium sp. ESL0704 TaxID=2983219 RepID=UPI0023F818AB|nr:ATP-binding cassette domain-containing protein [Bifidobacterium sp. ESL0704]WEV53096.1 ATP-binding cassette domain-containing protein [Bifidobacterium sp. ESL0704]